MLSLERTKRLLGDFIPPMGLGGLMTLEEARSVINKTQTRRGHQNDSRSMNPKIVEVPSVENLFRDILPLDSTFSRNKVDAVIETHLETLQVRLTLDTQLNSLKSLRQRNNWAAVPNSFTLIDLLPSLKASNQTKDSNLYDIRSLDYTLRDVHDSSHDNNRNNGSKVHSTYAKISFRDERHERDSLLWVSYASQIRKVHLLACLSHDCIP